MARQRTQNGQNVDIVTAAEIASFVYCPEQWRLQYGLGLSPQNQSALHEGTRIHERKAVAEQVAGASIDVGRVLLILGLVVLLLFWMISR